MSARAFAKQKSCTSNGCVWLSPASRSRSCLRLHAQLQERRLAVPPRHPEREKVSRRPLREVNWRACRVVSHLVVRLHPFLFFYRRDLTPALFTGRRIPLESVPEDEAECAAWLHKLYQKKVRVLKVGVLRGIHAVSHGELLSVGWKNTQRAPTAAISINTYHNVDYSLKLFSP